jgi:hypothetical protein
MVTRLRDTRLPFGIYKGLTFQQVEEIDFVDEEGFRQTGLGYLDWLAGNPDLGVERTKTAAPHLGKPWLFVYYNKPKRIELYGDFKKRLIAFLSYPSIARQLDELFPQDIIGPAGHHRDDSREACIGMQFPVKREEPIHYHVLRTNKKHGERKGQVITKYVPVKGAYERFKAQLSGTHARRHAEIGDLALEPACELDNTPLCPHCKGEGTVKVADKDMPLGWRTAACPACSGRGTTKQRKMRFVEAWSILVDFIVFIEEKFVSESYDPDDLFELDMAEVRKAAEVLQPINPGTVNIARSKYKAYRLALRRAKRHTINYIDDKKFIVPAAEAYRERMVARANPKPRKRKRRRV